MSHTEGGQTDDLEIIIRHGLLVPLWIEEGASEESRRSDLWRLAKCLRQVEEPITLTPELCKKLADIVDPDRRWKEGRRKTDRKPLLDLYRIFKAERGLSDDDTLELVNSFLGLTVEGKQGAGKKAQGARYTIDDLKRAKGTKA